MLVSVTLRHLSVAVLAIALLFASLRDSTSTGLILLLYLKVTLLLFASFRAKYGRGPSAAWWFGFAAFGWGHVVINIHPMSETVIHPNLTLLWPVNYFNIFDLTGVLAIRWNYLIYGANAGAISPSGPAMAIREWMTIGVAVIGGYISLVIDSRLRSKTGPDCRAGSESHSPGHADALSSATRPPSNPSHLEELVAPGQIADQPSSQ